ncbi:MAG: RNA methyltransferase [Verrucomicrobia bacterium]|nr:RNA methyltransferase [Verrucomicrobiota bacterium]
MISSLENSLVKQAVHLRERHWRNKLGLFLIEGYREILRAQESKTKLDHLFVCPELFLGVNEPKLIEEARASGCKIITCTDKVFKKISYRDRPDGLLAIAPQLPRDLHFLEEKLQGISSPLLIIAEAIEKPGNLGTILRSADAAGAHGVIISNRCTDIYNPNVVRASCGTLFSVPVVEATSEEVLAWLHKWKIQIIAAMPQAQALYTDINMTGPTAIAVGTEQLGLSHTWKTSAHIQARLPMCGKADSLNVAMATTLILYEALRQRNTV